MSYLRHMIQGSFYRRIPCELPTQVKIYQQMSMNDYDLVMAKTPQIDFFKNLNQFALL
ncbi:MAG: hypothetical protein DSM106950_36405 [Stigonema ocellatum SAG 48.90 = DSM 106950]|nr:hypothetical protein [Stigonema ocellatum SAG 48.90 = DSM 106950]